MARCIKHVIILNIIDRVLTKRKIHLDITIEVASVSKPLNYAETIAYNYDKS